MKYENNFIVIIAVAIAIYALFLFIADYNSISENINRFQIEYLIPILLLVAASWIPLIVKWNYLLKKNGINIPIRKSILIWFSGSALSIVPGQVGELIKSQLIKNIFDVRRSKTLPIIFAEKFYGLIAALIAFIIGNVVFAVNFALIFVTCILIFVTFFFVYYKPVFEFILNKVTKIKFFTKYTDNASESYETLRNSTNLTTSAICIILSFIYWVIISASVYLVFLAFDIETISFLESISIYTSSIILGIITLIPGGLGVTEGSLVGLLALKGIDVSSALLLVIVIRLVTYWFPVSIGFIGLKLSGGLSLSKNFKN